MKLWNSTEFGGWGMRTETATVLPAHARSCFNWSSWAHWCCRSLWWRSDSGWPNGIYTIILFSSLSLITLTKVVLEFKQWCVCVWFIAGNLSPGSLIRLESVYKKVSLSVFQGTVYNKAAATLWHEEATVWSGVLLVHMTHSAPPLPACALPQC